MDILSASIDLLDSTFPSEFIDLIDKRSRQHINIRRIAITSISAMHFFYAYKYFGILMIFFSTKLYMYSIDLQDWTKEQDHYSNTTQLFDINGSFQLISPSIGDNCFG